MKLAFKQGIMDNKESEQIEDERETNKIRLSLFVDNLKNNSFSEAVFEQTEKLQSELNETINNFIKNQNENFGYLDTEFLEDKLSALSEMSIVYAFKDFEINLKKLLKATYGTDTKEFYRWDFISDFLNSKKIKLTEIKGYKEVNQLRNINNHIKHSISNKISDKDKINDIPEFKSLKYLSHYELDDFYNRIKNFPYIFLDDLSTKIYADLYEI